MLNETIGTAAPAIDIATAVSADGRHPPLRRGRGGRRRAARRLARRPRRSVHGHHGPVGLGQVDAHAPARRPRPADGGQRLRRHAGHHDDERQGADQAAPPAHRLRLSVLQPAPDAQRRGERPAAADHRRAQGAARDDRRAARARRPQRAPSPPSVRALRRPAAARGHRPRADLRAHGPVRRRADRQPRLQRGRDGPRPAARRRRPRRPDHGHGHPRPAAPPRAPTASSSWPTGGSSPTSPSRPRPTSWRR